MSTNLTIIVLCTGYYQVPDSSKIKLLPAVKQLQLTAASHASDSTIDMAGKDFNGKTINGNSRRYEGSNVARPELEFRPTKNRHRYYPFIEVCPICISCPINYVISIIKRNTMVVSNFNIFAVCN